MLASSMLGATPKINDPNNSAFLYEKFTDEELDDTLARMEQERLTLDIKDTEGHAAYQRMIEQVSAEKKRRYEKQHRAQVRYSERPRASALIGGMAGPGAKSSAY